MSNTTDRTIAAPLVSRRPLAILIAFLLTVGLAVALMLSTSPDARAFPPNGPCSGGTPESLRVENDTRGAYLYLFGSYQCSRVVSAVLIAQVRQVLPNGTEAPLDTFGAPQMASSPFVEGYSPGYCGKRDLTTYVVYYSIQIDGVQYRDVRATYSLPCSEVPGMDAGQSMNDPSSAA